MIKLFVLLSIFTSATFAYPTGNIKIQNQSDFLDSLLEELEDQDVSDFDENAKNEIKKYQSDIRDLKKKLKNIKLEKENQNSNSEIEKLIKNYNEKLQELKKTYQYISSKIKHNNCPNEFSTNRAYKADSSDNGLNYYKKRKRNRDFVPLEIIEVDSDKSPTRITIQESER